MKSKKKLATQNERINFAREQGYYLPKMPGFDSKFFCQWLSGKRRKKNKDNKKLKTNFEFFNKNNEYDLEKSSSEESNLSDDFIYDNLDGKNKDEKEKLFTQKISKSQINVNRMSLNKKRNFIISEVMPIKEKTKENNNNFFESIKNMILNIKKNQILKIF